MVIIMAKIGRECCVCLFKDLASFEGSRSTTHLGISYLYVTYDVMIEHFGKSIFFFKGCHVKLKTSKQQMDKHTRMCASLG